MNPEVIILNNTGSVNISQYGSSNIYIATYKPTNSDIE
jgi:hypothetical protein